MEKEYSVETDKARELLERAFDVLVTSSDAEDMAAYKLEEEIRAYLAEPKVKREPLIQEEIIASYEWGPDAYECEWHWFNKGIRFAEHHHGIGGRDE